MGDKSLDRISVSIGSVNSFDTFGDIPVNSDNYVEIISWSDGKNLLNKQTIVIKNTHSTNKLKYKIVHDLGGTPPLTYDVVHGTTLDAGEVNVINIVNENYSKLRVYAKRKNSGADASIRVSVRL